MNCDNFDRLSDEVVTLIFNRVLDAKSLCRCSAVSKRFASIVSQTNDVSLVIPSGKSKPNYGVFCLRFLKAVFCKLMAKPFQFLHQIVLRKPSVSSDEDGDSTFHFTTRALKTFNEVRSLHLQLPCHGDELGSKKTGSFLKWKAEFGREMESCVLLAATSFHGSSRNRSSQKHKQIHHESVLATDEMKKRVVWMISSLIAASTRHWLVKQIIADCEMNPQKVVLSDSSKQGRLTMGKEQFMELRRSMDPALPVERTRVPEMCAKLWYVPELELPVSRRVMKGATLIVIRPVDKVMEMEDDGEVLGGFFDGEEEEEAFREAVKEMLKEKQPYKMEMGSF